MYVCNIEGKCALVYHHKNIIQLRHTKHHQKRRMCSKVTKQAITKCTQQAWLYGNSSCVSMSVYYSTEIHSWWNTQHYEIAWLSSTTCTFRYSCSCIGLITSVHSTAEKVYISMQNDGATHRPWYITILAPTLVAITGVARMLLNSSATFEGSTTFTCGAHRMNECSYIRDNYNFTCPLVMVATWPSSESLHFVSLIVITEIVTL